MAVMSSRSLRPKLERLVGPIALAIVVFEPVVDWLVSSLQHGRLANNPYSIDDVHLILIFALLVLIYEAITKQHEDDEVGDESKIIMNRNQSDYYEIWEEVRRFRAIEIDAVGHSFNTLWFNFLKKFLYEFIGNEKHFDSIYIRLVATKSEPASYRDIRDFYRSLDMQAARKVVISLNTVPSDMLFFTGLCVNKSALWLSIREPYSVVKVNEHVREWRRSDGGTAEKMVNWYVGLADYLSSKGTVELLKVGSSATESVPDAHVV